MQNVKISVIIPVFNSQTYLLECLDSVLNQTFRDFEIICIDDGSTDFSPQILADFALKDSRVKIITQKNHGQSVARNKGISTANGKYLVFLDSDDFMSPEMLEKLYNKVITDHADFTMCSIKVLDEKTNTATEHECYHSLDIIPQALDEKVFTYKELKDFLFRICVVPWNKIYKTEFLKENAIKFTEGINCFEDTLFFLQSAVCAQRISLIRDCLVNYRHFSANSCSTNIEQDFKKLGYFKIFKLQKKFLKQKNVYSELEKQFLARQKSELITWYNKMPESKAKRAYARKLYLTYPSLVFKNFGNKFKNRAIIKRINSLTENEKIMFRGASEDLLEVLRVAKFKHFENILGIIEADPLKIGKEYFGIKVYDYSILSKIMPDKLVLSATNIYNFDKLVKCELSAIGLGIGLDIETFGIQRD